MAWTGVDGGSLIHLNAHLSPEFEVFDSGWPAGVDHWALEPFYTRVEGVLEPRSTPDRLDKVRAFAAGAHLERFAAAGAHLERPFQLVPLARTERHGAAVLALHEAVRLEARGAAGRCGRSDVATCTTSTVLAVNLSKAIAALVERGIEHYLSERSGR